MKTSIKVGKYTLESLTTGMYNDPKIAYREYIQNSVDALEEAITSSLISEKDAKINITIDKEKESVSIYDNGVGIRSLEAYQMLTNIGNSKKRHSINRGFRGIGRLGGLSYCGTLKFITSYKGENIQSIVEFNCKKLRQLLVPGENDNYDLSQVINNVTTHYTQEEDINKHYFIVEMSDIDSFCGLLDIDNIKSYLRQIAPLPYKKKFIWKEKINKFLKDNRFQITEFSIYIGQNRDKLEQLFKPNRDKFITNKQKKHRDEISDIETFAILHEGETLALGWYGKSNFYGTIINKELSGIRTRKGNILIGNDKLLNDIFRESRFNGWVQGEIFVISHKLIPNARRDDFEQNETYFKFIDELKHIVGDQISKEIRESSKNRNKPLQKKIIEAEKKVNEANEIEKEGFNSKVEKEKYKEGIEKTKKDIEKIKTINTEENEKKEIIISKINNTLKNITGSKNYKTNKIKSISKKERRILHIITDIISEYIVDKDIVDEIIERIDAELSQGGKV